MSQQLSIVWTVPFFATSENRHKRVSLSLEQVSPPTHLSAPGERFVDSMHPRPADPTGPGVSPQRALGRVSQAFFLSQLIAFHASGAISYTELLAFSFVTLGQFYDSQPAVEQAVSSFSASLAVPLRALLPSFVAM